MLNFYSYHCIKIPMANINIFCSYMYILLPPRFFFVIIGRQNLHQISADFQPSSETTALIGLHFTKLFLNTIFFRIKLLIHFFNSSWKLLAKKGQIYYINTNKTHWDRLIYIYPVVDLITSKRYIYENFNMMKFSNIDRDLN